jgi:hypothetical protein
MSARPTQPVGEDGQPITLGVATYANTTLEPADEDVLGHVATAMPTEDGNDPGPKIVL